MTGTYDPQLLVLSVLLAVCSAFTALNLAQRVAVSRGVAARGWLGTGAAAVGAGLWAAQFFWMLAFRLPVPVVHHQPTMVFSLAFAVLVAFFALWIVSGPRIHRLRLLIAGACMGIGLVAVHFTGLFAMQVIPAVFYDTRGIAWTVAVAVTASWLMLWLAFVLRQSCTLPMLIARAGAGLFVGMAIGAVFHLGLRAARFAPDSYSLGAAAEPSVAGAERVLLVIAVLSALGLLVVMALTIVDHARQHAQAMDTSALADRDLLERRFSAMHEVPGDPPLIALMLVDPAMPDGTDPAAAERAAVQRELGRRLAALVRPGDTVGVNQGQFVLLLAGLRDPEQTPGIAARVREVIGSPVLLGDREVVIQPAIGTSFFPHQGGDLDTLLRLARVALARH